MDSLNIRNAKIVLHDRFYRSKDMDINLLIMTGFNGRRIKYND
jgi:hypothetical protein